MNHLNILKYFLQKTQLSMLPNQVQSVLIEQNKLILEKFNRVQKQTSFTYSGANSIDGEGSSGNLMPSTTNVLKIPTISTNVNRF